MEKIIEKLVRNEIPFITSVEKDSFIQASEKAFDCIFDGISTFYPWCKPENLPADFNLGVIYGASGSGKSSLLNEFGNEIQPRWHSGKAIISHFASTDEAITKLGAVGLNTIPSWYKPYDVLSNGEKFRADLSRKLFDGATIDEFSSVVDRDVAKASSMSFSRYIKKKDIKNIVISTCHEDILEWLEPDWVINTNTGEVYNSFFIKDQISISKYIAQTTISGPCLKTITI